MQGAESAVGYNVWHGAAVRRIVVLVADPVRARPVPQDGVDGQPGWRAEAWSRRSREDPGVVDVERHGLGDPQR